MSKEPEVLQTVVEEKTTGQDDRRNEDHDHGEQDVERPTSAHERPTSADKRSTSAVFQPSVNNVVAASTLRQTKHQKQGHFDDSDSQATAGEPATSVSLLTPAASLSGSVSDMSVTDDVLCSSESSTAMAGNVSSTSDSCASVLRSAASMPAAVSAMPEADLTMLPSLPMPEADLTMLPSLSMPESDFTMLPSSAMPKADSTMLEAGSTMLPGSAMPEADSSMPQTGSATPQTDPCIPEGDSHTANADSSMLKAGPSLSTSEAESSLEEAVSRLPETDSITPGAVSSTSSTPDTNSVPSVPETVSVSSEPAVDLTSRQADSGEDDSLCEKVKEKENVQVVQEAATTTPRKLYESILSQRVREYDAQMVIAAQTLSLRSSTPPGPAFTDFKDYARRRGQALGSVWRQQREESSQLRREAQKGRAVCVPPWEVGDVRTPKAHSRSLQKEKKVRRHTFPAEGQNCREQHRTAGHFCGVCMLVG